MDNTDKPSSPPRSSLHRHRTLRRAGVLVLLLAIALVWWHPWKRSPNHARHPGGKGQHGGPAALAALPQPVQVASATVGDMPIVLNALGTVTPLATVTVRTQLAGILQTVSFHEGQLVQKNAMLAQIDPRPYQNALATAEGTLARDQALLTTARLDLKRYQTLLQQDSIARQQVDTQASLVRQYEGTVKTDQAAIDAAKLNLMYARITSPITGRVGLRQVDPGNYVTPSDTNGVVVVTQLQPISVIFTTSEDNLQAILKRVKSKARLAVTVYNRDNTNELESGTLETLDNQIDTATGTVKLRAIFANRNNQLFPNQFVNTRLLVDTLRDVTIVPSAAVLTGSIGPFVYVVKADNTVTVRKIQPGIVDGERTSIVSGIAVGERVVTDGSDRLREGTVVSIPADRPKPAADTSAAASSSKPAAHASAAASSSKLAADASPAASSSKPAAHASPAASSSKPAADASPAASSSKPAAHASAAASSSKPAAHASAAASSSQPAADASTAASSSRPPPRRSATPAH